MPKPVSSIFGKIFTGFFVSSATLTESSKPTIAKKPNDVAVVTARKAFLSSAVSKATTREMPTSPPWVNAQKPTKMTSTMKSNAMVTTPLVPQSNPKPLKMFDAKKRDAVDAERLVRV
jgi:hypothetical protein